MIARSYEVQKKIGCVWHNVNWFIKKHDAIELVNLLNSRGIKTRILKWGYEVVN
jgi:hypothetical protein